MYPVDFSTPTLQSPPSSSCGGAEASSTCTTIPSSSTILMEGIKPRRSRFTTTLSRPSTPDVLNPEDMDLSVSYLEKDAAMQRVNQELEKRSNEIFEKIEKYYSSKCLQNRAIPEAGDASVSPPPPFQKYEDLQYSSTSPTNANKDDLESLASFESNKGRSGSAASSILSSSNRSSSSTCINHTTTTPSHDTKDVDIKARKRLQKATESVVQCLQSKLFSHEERLADLYIQFRQKIQENTMLEGKIRALEDDRERLLKSMHNLQVSAEKSTKAAEGAKSNLNLKMQAFAALKKDVDILRRDQKQKAGVVQNLQTRLNRCLDENERLKQHNRSLQQNIRDKQHEDRLLTDELQQKVCQLEQQKSILNATIGKQAGLIKTLRQQRV